MKKLMIFLAMAAMIGLTAFCVSGATWEKVYPELGNSKASRVCQTIDGGYAFTGNKYIAKVDSLGNLRWYKIYRQDNYTSGCAIKETPGDSGLAILSYHSVTGELYGNFWLIRTNSQGDTLWTRNYGTSRKYPFDMDITSDSGFIMSGKVILPSGKANVYLVRADKNGNLLWERSYTQGTWGLAIKTVGDSFTILSLAYDGGDTLKFVLFKIDENGDPIWRKTYGHENAHWSSDFSLTSDSGYILTGCIDNRARSTWIVKTDKNGNEEWNKSYGHDSLYPQGGRSVWQTEDNGYIVIADIYRRGSPHTERCISLLKLDESGDSLWRKTFTGPTGVCRSDWGGIPTSDGGAIIAGLVYNLPEFACTAYLIKTDKDGNVGIEEDFPVPEIFTIRVFPNPSRGEIYFETDSPKPIEFKIYDISGRLVKETRVERNLRMNSPSGIYFWKTEKSGGKIIVVR